MSDLINRDAAIELCDWYEHEYDECEYALRALADDLQKLPSIEPKTGKWKEVQSYGSSTNPAICECFACGDTVWVYTGKRAWKYCPNCGARMEGEQNG